MQRYNFLTYLQNFRWKKFTFRYCFNHRLHIDTFLHSIHIIYIIYSSRNKTIYPSLKWIYGIPLHPILILAYNIPLGIFKQILRLLEAALQKNVAYPKIGDAFSPNAPRQLGRESNAALEKKISIWIRSRRDMEPNTDHGMTASPMVIFMFFFS